MLKKYWRRSFLLEGLVLSEVQGIEDSDLDQDIWDEDAVGLRLEKEVLEEDVDFLLDALHFVEARVEDLAVLHQDVAGVHREELVRKYAYRKLPISFGKIYFLNLTPQFV